jgi:hypothetical protein
LIKRDLQKEGFDINIVRTEDEVKPIFYYFWFQSHISVFFTVSNYNTMEQRALKNVNNCLYTKIYSYLETSGGISYNSY